MASAIKPSEQPEKTFRIRQHRSPSVQGTRNRRPFEQGTRNRRPFEQGTRNKYRTLHPATPSAPGRTTALQATPRTNPICFNCTKPRHRSRQCRSEPYCPHCKTKGHCFRDCTVRRRVVPKQTRQTAGTTSSRFNLPCSKTCTRLLHKPANQILHNRLSDSSTNRLFKILPSLAQIFILIFVLAATAPIRIHAVTIINNFWTFLGVTKPSLDVTTTPIFLRQEEYPSRALTKSSAFFREEDLSTRAFPRRQEESLIIRGPYLNHQQDIRKPPTRGFLHPDILCRRRTSSRTPLHAPPCEPIYYLAATKPPQKPRETQRNTEKHRETQNM